MTLQEIALQPPYSCRLDAVAAPATAVVPGQVVAQGVGVRYGRHEVLRDVSLNLPQGSITALMGPSGCGKTSFLNCLNRMTDLLPGCSVTGELRLDGRSILGRDVDLINLRRRVGMIFQRPNPFPFSIRRNLEFPLREAGIRNRHRIEDAIEGSLRTVGLWDHLKDRLDQSAVALSGGQQQRLCIARALLLEPEVLLMDEPCSALDPMSSATVEELIVSLRGRCTLVVVTHNLAQARRIADWCAVFWVKDGVGCIVESGPTEQIFAAPKSETTAAYINGVVA